MLGVNFGHGVDVVLGCVRVGTGGKGGAVKCHAFFKLSREQRARLQENQLFVVVAKGLFGL